MLLSFLFAYALSETKTYQIGGVTIPLEIPTSGGTVAEASFYDPFLRKTVTTGKIGTYNGGTGCWAFGSYIYRQAFGTSFSKTKNRITPANTLTPVTAENLEYYILQAGPGAILRTTNQTAYSSSDSDGHTMVIVDADEEGVTIYHASGKGYIYYGNETRAFTWEEFAASIQRGSVSSGKKNIKYVIYPGDITFNDIIKAENAVPAERIQIGGLPAYALVGEKYACTYTLFPENALDSGVFWKSADPSVAKVNSETGEIRMLSPGQTVITAACQHPSDATDQKTLIVLPTLSDFTFALPEGTKSVLEYAFSDIGAKYVHLPEGLERIEAGAFSGAPGLVCVYVPLSVNFISDTAFENCAPFAMWTENEYAKEYALQKELPVVSFE